MFRQRLNLCVWERVARRSQRQSSPTPRERDADMIAPSSEPEPEPEPDLPGLICARREALAVETGLGLGLGLVEDVMHLERLQPGRGP